MSEGARQTLARIVTQYGPSVADDPRRCEGLLRDLCGDSRREINILVTAVKEKVVSDLQAGSGIPLDALIGRAVKKLHDNAGIAEDLARWAVESWALALGVLAPETLSILSQRTEPSRAVATHPKTWFYSHNGEPQQGPFSATDIRRMAAAGQLLRTDHLWKAGMPGWVAASSVKNMFPDAAPLATRMNIQAAPLSPASGAINAPPAYSPLPAGSANPLAPAFGDPRAAAREALKVPSICLVVVGVLGAFGGMCGSCVGVVALLIPSPRSQLSSKSNFSDTDIGTPSQPRDRSEDGPGILPCLLYFPLGIMNAVIAYSALQMMNLRKYSLALIGSILAIIPCTGCFLVGIPVGIWALVLLNKPEIKSAFE